MELTLDDIQLIERALKHYGKNAILHTNTRAHLLRLQRQVKMTLLGMES